MLEHLGFNGRKLHLYWQTSDESRRGGSQCERRIYITSKSSSFSSSSSSSSLSSSLSLLLFLLLLLLLLFPLLFCSPMKVRTRRQRARDGPKRRPSSQRPSPPLVFILASPMALLHLKEQILIMAAAAANTDRERERHPHQRKDAEGRMISVSVSLSLSLGFLIKTVINDDGGGFYMRCISGSMSVFLAAALISC